jgi:hypothetical protein
MFNTDAKKGSRYVTNILVTVIRISKNDQYISNMRGDF